MKKSMSSLDLAAWIAVSAPRLARRRVANIYAHGPGLLVFKFKGIAEELVVEPGRRMHLTRRRIRFGALGAAAQVLRKYLRGKMLAEARQHGFERIAELVFEPGGLRLVVELLPRGAAVLLGGDGRILFSTRYAEYRDRSIKRGEPYTPPPPVARNPLDLEAEELLEALGKAPDVVRGLIRGLGWPPELAEEALRRAGVPKDRKPGSLGNEEASRILEAARSIYGESVSSPTPTVAYSEGRPILVAPFKPSYLEDAEIRVFESLDEALDTYFSELRGPGGEDPEEARLRRALEEARLSAERYRREAEELRGIAALAAQRVLELEEKLDCARRVRGAEGWSRVPEICGVSGVDPSRGLVYVELDGHVLGLDVRLSAEKNVLELYRRAGELEAKARRAEGILGSVEERLEELRRRRELRRLREEIRGRPREWYEKYHWLISSEGFLVIGGRNIDQNESLVRRYLEPRDIFLHADIHGAPVVVIKTEGRMPGEATLREAAVIAASYSKAWREGLAHVDVYWAWGEQVSKSPPPGEYLPKGSFMVYGKRNYIRAVPLRIALGIQYREEMPRVVVGPEDLVASKARVYAVLIPGSLKPLEAAERILKGFSRMDPEHALIYEALGAEELADRIPGPSRIISVKKGGGKNS